MDQELQEGLSATIQWTAASKPTFPCSAQKPAIYYFLQFFPLALFTMICKYTNKVLASKKNDDGTIPKTKMTTTNEIKAWFGMRFAMACSKVSNVKKYWATGSGWQNHLISRTMARHRYDEISGCLMLEDPDNRQTNLDTWPNETKDDRKLLFQAMKANPLYRINRIWDTVLNNCPRLYNVSREIAVDEAMVGYKGTKASLNRVFMPLKPIRVGFKI